MKDEMAEDFTPAHHALLFAWLSRAVIDLVGQERGIRAIRQAVRQYGEERGHRMACRARGDGAALTMTSFMAYGEWQALPGASAQTLSVEENGVRSRVHRCPWHRAWEEAGLMEYGRLYCLEIDAALARGFNPALKLEVRTTLSNDGQDCEFVFHQAESPGEKKGRVMPWSYHLGHLYWTMRRVLAAELGELGRAAAAAARQQFVARYGETAAQALDAHRDTDFRQLPEAP